MRWLFELAIALALMGSVAACGGGGGPGQIQGSPAVRTPSTPLPSPVDTGGYGY